MKRNHGFRVATSIALALGLTACAGGEGLGYSPAPPATPTPTPTPTSTATALSISAPMRASTPTDTAAVLASTGGPNFTSGTPASTVFPLLQTVMIYGASAAQPDTAANSAGGTATFQQGALNLNVAAFRNALPDYRYSSSGYANLDWTRAGYWVTGGNKWDYDDAVGLNGVFLAGYQTPQSGMPATGTATYAGLVQGTVFHLGQAGDYPNGTGGSTHCACDVLPLSGNALFTANFGARSVAGTMTGMTVGSAAWNDVAFNSTITGNGFSGTTNVTSAPAGRDSLTGSATGTIQGLFFGPTGEEAGAVWTLFDGTNAAMGTLTGKHP